MKFVWRFTASVALAAAIVIEWYHVMNTALGWNGMRLSGPGISYVLLAVWLAAEAGIWSARPWLKVLTALGVVLAFAHGVVLALGGTNGVGVLFVAISFVVGIATAFARREELRSPPEEIEYRKVG